MRVLNLPVPVADAGVDFDIARRDRATVGSAPATEPPVLCSESQIAVPLQPSTRRNDAHRVDRVAARI